MIASRAPERRVPGTTGIMAFQPRPIKLHPWRGEFSDGGHLTYLGA